MKQFLLSILCRLRGVHRLRFFRTDPAGLYCRTCGRGVPGQDGRRPEPRFEEDAR
jgi:hypothetical protein